MLQNEVEHLKNQIQVARNEINKLRQQVRSLQHKQRKDVDGIADLLKNYRCEGCRQLDINRDNNGTLSLKVSAKTTPTEDRIEADQLQQPTPLTTKNHDIEYNLLLCRRVHVLFSCCRLRQICFNSIGVIRTCFPEKRAVPRQSSVGEHFRGQIDLHADLFTNPEHALEGLEEYSHLWIIYHFHKNTAHPKAKVAPPRLTGERVGVFATRSPHRPCPLGLSLVEIDKIDASSISFYGTDMVDGTPVLDIKPYIPYYDAPITQETGRVSVGLCDNASDFYDSRQDPDGEESEMELLGAAAMAQTPVNFSNYVTPPPLAVKVPAWVQAPPRLRVEFNERAAAQLKTINVQQQCIVDVLEADPRSVYLRTKYNSQIFTFQLSEVTVTCKFDDKNNIVTVLQIRPTDHMTVGEEISTTGSGEGQAFLKYAQKIADPSSNDLMHMEYHVVYSVTYQVPVLYLQGHRHDGKIITLEKAWDIFKFDRNDDETRLTRQQMLNILTQMEHPILFKPYLCLHPCRTAELLSQTPNSCNRIITFISLMGPYVRLNLPLAYCLEIEK
uniref:TsaA-like domain-containing protein n=1 Tax=Glossina brevipalpis TaxID=37001 RepID=A0A1A9W6Z1_9MUSC